MAGKKQVVTAKLAVNGLREIAHKKNSATGNQCKQQDGGAVKESLA